MVEYSHDYNPSTWEVEAGESLVQDEPGLHIEFLASLSYIVRPSQKKKKKMARLAVWLKQ
jgi:hypothetical protein